MAKQRKILLTVTNDLNYDQRMIRICTALSNAGYDVTLIGFKRKNSKTLAQRAFKQVRIPIIVEKGKLLYLDYWIKLFFYLLFKRADAICAIDLDTILPVFFASKLKGCKRVYDAHELFTDLREVISRPSVHKMWLAIERFAVPRFRIGYTIGDCYAEEFNRRYGSNYKVVRNATVLTPLIIPAKPEKIILYQGWVNVGRRFEELIPAMQFVDAQLIVCGEGNFYAEAKALTAKYQLEHKVIFKGYVPPEELRQYTLSAYIGITLFEDTGLSNRLSLANRFFDYMHAGVPQVCNKYPEYERVNERFEVARLVDDPTPENIGAAINALLHQEDVYQKMQKECLRAREVFCWQNEEQTLLQVYADLFKTSGA